MTLSRYVRNLYTIDTLDKRLSTPSINARTEPVTRDPAEPSTTRRRSPAEDVSPSKWRTPEFYFYYLVFLIAVPMMFKSVYDVSKESDPNYTKFAPLLSPGWIPGRKVDNSDNQYSNFRDNIPYLFGALLLHSVLRRLFDAISGSDDTKNGSISSSVTVGYAESQNRLNRRINFDLVFGGLFIVALHGVSAFKILLILYTNYRIATAAPKGYIAPLTWTFNIGILFANELCEGYRFADLARILQPGIADPKTVNWGTWLDSFSGLHPRWEVTFNFSILRLISFNFDYLWSQKQLSSSPVEKKQLDLRNLSERDRISTSVPQSDYNFRNYLAYALYSPLYIAGPILTFNDYIHQIRFPLSSASLSRAAAYGIRFLLALLSMELILHFIYAVAISKSHPAWETYTPFQLSMLGYFNLHIIWLKLLLPWRFFRFWSLIDGIDPPENMVRCMSNNYSALAFWRSWHRSYNRWIVRYIFIPLGGSGARSSASATAKNARAIVNYLAVFTFVALWHDINLRLLVWGWLITLFILPEAIATYLFPKRKWESHREAYRVICGVGAVGNILMMMAANLVGFAVGLDGLKGLVQGIFGNFSGLVFFVAACATLFVGVQVMFEIREHEKRHGIRLKC